MKLKEAIERHTGIRNAEIMVKSGMVNRGDFAILNAERIALIEDDLGNIVVESDPAIVIENRQLRSEVDRLRRVVAHVNMTTRNIENV